MPTTTANVLPSTIDTDIRAHAAACGRLDCGHLSRSSSLAVRRAVILYIAEGAGYTVRLRNESPEVAAVLGILRQAEHPRPVYVRGTNTNGNAGYVRSTPNEVLLPDASGLTITPERATVFALAWQGLSATEISIVSLRARETVKSHMGNLRRMTGAHDATSALVALVLANKIDANVEYSFPEDDEDATEE